MSTFGEELVRSAREALAIARCKLELGRAYTVEGRDVRAEGPQSPSDPEKPIPTAPLSSKAGQAARRGDRGGDPC